MIMCEELKFVELLCIDVKKSAALGTASITSYGRQPCRLPKDVCVEHMDGCKLWRNGRSLDVKSASGSEAHMQFSAPWIGPDGDKLP